jgi:hypothetical protein
VEHWVWYHSELEITKLVRRGLFRDVQEDNFDESVAFWIGALQDRPALREIPTLRQLATWVPEALSPSAIRQLIWAEQREEMRRDGYGSG